MQLVMFAGIVPAQLVAEVPRSFRVVGYLPDYRLPDFDAAALDHLTDLVLFSVEPTATGQLNFSRLEQAPLAHLRSLKTQHRVRLILCVGGWDRSTHFKAVVESDQHRRVFVENMVKTCLEQRFDGVDLDWEHPQNAAEQAGYAQLLIDLRQAFEPHGLVLSVTLAAWQQLPPTAFEAVHWVQVMAYDHAGRHSTFEDARTDVAKLLAAGVPQEKLTLGLPFYGRDFVQPEHTLTYREIVAQNVLAPDTNEVGQFYFNGPHLIQQKTQYALNIGLAGVMVWEIGQDTAGEKSLLKLIRTTVQRGPQE